MGFRVYLIILFAFIFSFTNILPQAISQPQQNLEPIASSIDLSSYDLWYSDYIKSNKVGWANETRGNTNLDGQMAVYTKSHSEAVIKRFDSVMNILDDTEYFESPDGSPIKYKQTMYEGDTLDSVVEILVRNNNVEITTTNRGSNNSTKNRVPFTGTLYFPYGIDRLYMQNNKNNFEYQTITPGLTQKILHVKVIYMGPEATDLIKDKRVLNKYKVEIQEYPEFETYEWRDDNAILIKSSSSVMNSTRYLSNETDAKQLDSDKTVDILTDYLVSSRQAISDPGAQTRATYLITIKGSTPIKGLFINDHRQKIVSQSSDSVEMNIDAYLPQNMLEKIPVQNEKFKPYLDDNDYIQPYNPKISSIAKKVAGNEKNALMVAKMLEKWVGKNMVNKNYGTGLAPASEVIETLAGDCTEHAILLASMLRAVGIPSQVVSGLVYLPVAGSDQGAFGYHMWTEAYVGQWIQLDATRPNDFVADATHIAMNKSTFNSNQDAEALNDSILKVLGNLNIDIIKHTSKSTSFYDISQQASKNIEPIDIAAIAASGQGMANTPYQSVNLDRYKIIADKMIDKYNLSGLPNTSPILESAEGQFTKGMAYYAKGDIDRSLKYFKKAVEMIPGSEAKKYYDMGVRLSGVMMFSLARTQLEKASVLNADIWSAKANNYLDKYFPVGEYSFEAEKSNFTGFSYSNFTNNAPAAILMFQKAIEDSPRFDSALYNLAMVYLSQGDLDNALINLNAAAAINQTNPTIFSALAETYDQLGRYSEAQVNYEKAIGLNKDDPNFVNNMKFKIAAIKARQLVQKNPKNVQAYLMVGQTALEIEQYDQAEKAFVKALSINPSLAAAHSGLGKTFARQSKTIKAEAEFNKALKLNGSDKDALFGMAVIHKRRYNTAQALKYINKAIAVNPANNEYKIELGDIYFENGKYSQALAQYSRIKNSYGYYKQGVVYKALRKKDNAVQMLEQAMHANPLDARPYAELARIYMDEGNAITAKDYVQKAIDLDTNYSDAYYVMGLINEKEGNKVQAALDFINAFTIQPTNAEAYIKARQMYEELDEIANFPLPRPKHVPTRAEREYIIKLLYLEAVHTNAAILFMDGILQNCKNGLNVSAGDLGSKYILQGFMDRYLTNLKYIYHKAYALKPPPSLAKFHVVYLESLWLEADMRTKELHSLDYAIFDTTEEAKELRESVKSSREVTMGKIQELYIFINNLNSNWDPISFDEIVDSSGFDTRMMQSLVDKQMAVVKRTQESYEQLMKEGFKKIE